MIRSAAASCSVSSTAGRWWDAKIGLEIHAQVSGKCPWSSHNYMLIVIALWTPQLPPSCSPRHPGLCSRASSPTLVSLSSIQLCPVLFLASTGACLVLHHDVVSLVCVLMKLCCRLRVAVQQAIRAASAFKCEINKTSYFERKHYFYQDLPLGYQVSRGNTCDCKFPRALNL